MRLDAQRNRDHVLATARGLFAESGAKVSIDEIARAAGVGVGTVHRHFPTKEDLIEAVLVLACEPIVEALDEALDHSPELTAIKATITSGLDTLVAKAQSSGQIRGDIGTGDLRLIFDGLHSPAPTPLPGDALAL